MNLLTRTEIPGLHHHPIFLAPSLTPPNFLSLQQNPILSLSTISPFFSPTTHFSTSKPKFNSRNFRVLRVQVAWFQNNEEAGNILSDDLTEDGEVYKRTLRLVECSMFAALGGLAYILSSSLAIEARALGTTCYVVMYSFLIRENILALITINIHASLTYILTALGFITSPSMNAIYAIFGILLLMNCGFFVFLLHLLYSVFFTRLGMKESMRLPGWLDKAI